MAITQAMPKSFKQEILVGTHNFTAATDIFKLALYTSAATMDENTTVYSATNEVAASGSYAAGGGALTSTTPALSGSAAVCDFADINFTTATITARGALIYNSSKSNKACAVLDFGSDKSSSGGTFSIIFPAPDASNAIIRIT